MPSESFIRAFFETFNQRDLDKMDNLFNPDAEFYFPKSQLLIGKKRILKFLSIILPVSPIEF